MLYSFFLALHCLLSKVQTFLVWHFKAFYDLAGTFFCFLYLPYHKSIVPLHVLSSSIALLIMFHLLEILFIYFLCLPIQLQLIFPSPRYNVLYSMKLSLIPLSQKYTYNILFQDHLCIWWILSPQGDQLLWAGLFLAITLAIYIFPHTVGTQFMFIE